MESGCAETRSETPPSKVAPLLQTRVPILESNVMSGPEKIRSRGSWSHIVSKATDA